jgi:phytol kinase
MQPMEYQLVSANSTNVQELQKELFRKGIHLFIAFVPILASIHLFATFILLGTGILVYAVAELLRFQGINVPIISRVTEYASRERDKGKIVLGPVTLGLGAMAALFFYPDPAASLAIYALAFGDGLSSVVGKLLGRTTIPFTGGKTYAGSFACFFAVFFFSLFIVRDPKIAVVAASSATLLEALPLKDLDNVVIPLGTGLSVYITLIL